VFGQPSEYPSSGSGPETEKSRGFCFRLTAVYWSRPGDLGIVRANHDVLHRRRLVYKDVGSAPGIDSKERLVSRICGPIPVPVAHQAYDRVQLQQP